MSMQTSEDILKQFGFYKSGSCNCGGVRNIKYKNGKYICYLRPGKEIFRIKEKNSFLDPFQPVSLLKNALNKIFPHAVAMAEKI